MSSRAWHPAVAAAVALVAVPLVVVAAGGPASAQTPVSPEVRDVPDALDADLSPAEQRTLSALTDGSGVRLSALVDTGDGPQVVSLEAGDRADAAAAVRLLDGQPSVEAAELPRPVRPVAGAYRQYGNAVVRSAEARADVDGPLAAVTVAVLDTGVAAHPELAAALLPGRNVTDAPGGVTDATDRHGHGTHVAGTIAADAGSAVEGVAHGARILPVKVLDDDGRGWTDWTAEGIVWAADHGADVINLSLGGPSTSPVQRAAIEHARSRGVTVVAAAGNANSSRPQYPAADPGVISVAAVGESRSKASFSNFGGSVDLTAPGVGIVSTYLSGQVAWMSGTSMAAPHVAGVAALVEAAAPGLSPRQVERVLVAGVADLGAPGRDDLFGHGLVDAVRAVRAANALADGDTLPAVAPSIGSLDPLSGSVRVRWAAPADDGGTPVTGYRVHAFRDGAAVSVTPVPASTTSVVVGGLANGAGYRFAVAAVNAAGTGALSSSAAVTPRTVPGAPRIGKPEAARRAAVVRWSAPSGDGGETVDAYVVRAYSGDRLVRTVTVPASERSVTVRDLRPRRSHVFRVLARNDAGLGQPSAASERVRPRR